MYTNGSNAHIIYVMSTKLITRAQCLHKIGMKSNRWHTRQLLKCMRLPNKIKTNKQSSTSSVIISRRYMALLSKSI